MWTPRCHRVGVRVFAQDADARYFLTDALQPSFTGDFAPDVDYLLNAQTLTPAIRSMLRGYGVTLGNSLRRVLLSSIPGAAITYVKIDKVLHEFSTIPGVKEDTTELLLNLKDVYVKVFRNGTGETKHEPKTIRINVKGEGVVTGADVECPEDVEIVDYH